MDYTELKEESTYSYVFGSLQVGNYKERPRLYSRESLRDAITFTENDCGFILFEPEEKPIPVEHDWETEGF